MEVKKRRLMIYMNEDIAKTLRHMVVDGFNNTRSLFLLFLVV